MRCSIRKEWLLIWNVGNLSNCKLPITWVQRNPYSFCATVELFVRWAEQCGRGCIGQGLITLAYTYRFWICCTSSDNACSTIIDHHQGRKRGRITAIIIKPKIRSLPTPCYFVHPVVNVHAFCLFCSTRCQPTLFIVSNSSSVESTSNQSHVCTFYRLSVYLLDSLSVWKLSLSFMLYTASMEFT